MSCDLNDRDVLNTAAALVKHSSAILSLTPCPIRTAAEVIHTNEFVANVETAAQAIKQLSEKYPNNIIVENEGKFGYYLSYYFTDVLLTLTGYNKENPKNNNENAMTDYAAVRSLFQSQSYLDDLFNGIKRLTISPTMVENFKVITKREQYSTTPLTLICNLGSWKQCSKANREECSYKIHFERIVDPAVDNNVDDCSYLDTCFKGKQCKFAHYRVKLPEKYKPHLLPEPCYYPAQYINADLLSMNMSHLGNNYKALIIDPPWDIHTNPKANGTGCSDHELMNLKIDLLQTDGVVFLWVTGRVLEFGRQCLKKWGYRNLEEIIWLKTNQLSRTICTGRTGHWLNHTKEHVLVGVKGNMEFALNGMLNTDVIVSTTLGKSQKPKELYSIIENSVGLYSKKLELFGRKSNIRPGWLTIGNELGKTKVIDPELKRKLRIN